MAGLPQTKGENGEERDMEERQDFGAQVRLWIL